MFNPDYPTNLGSFLQHTYRPMENANESFYWAGGAVNPFGNQYNNMDSRRNMGVVGCFPTMGMNNNPPQVANSEANVMPFSTYPPSTPTANNNFGTTPAFNSLLDSRRNAPMPTNTNAAVNPWATNQAQQPQITPQMNQSTSFSNPWSNPYMNPQGMCGYNAYCSDPSTMALYEGLPFGYDKKAVCWENQYTVPRQVQSPVVNWNTNLNPMGQQQSVPQPMYPTQMPKTNMTWAEIAERNWGSNNL